MPATIADGLIQFYSSQADLLLSQYENINQLLGPTTDWTHPGTHCEVLLRDSLRRHLLAWMSVDKGYIFGRTEREGKDRHCPEIDILIHDSRDYRPVFRLDDFVIVQPEAVLGIIQVKRILHSGTGNNERSLAKGMRQVAEAKQHLLNYRIQRLRRPNRLELDERPRAFGAVVAFEDATDREPETYRRHLLDAYCCSHEHSYPESQWDIGLTMLPDFVGSIRHKCLFAPRFNTAHIDYYVYDSMHDERNIGLQLFLFAVTNAVFEYGNVKPPFAFPNLDGKIGVIRVPEPSESRYVAPMPQG